MARMAIKLPDSQAKILIVSETRSGCQCRDFLMPDMLPGARVPQFGSVGLKSSDDHFVPDPLYAAPRERHAMPAGCLSMQLTQLLARLANGEPLSGAGLAEQAGVTRAAIWKQVEALRARGVPIESRGPAGYQLPWPLQMLDEEQIRTLLPASMADSLGAMEVHWELDSTSSELQRRGPETGDLSIVLAESQTAGRGRRGRQWLSPPGLNLYLSCLKRFEHGFAALSGLSLAVGVMVLRALYDLGIAGAGLKWPNDILAQNGDGQRGKLGGILVELSGEYQGPCAAVIGIGLNLRLTPALREQAGQPASDLATLTNGVLPDRNRVAAALIKSLVKGLRQFEVEGFAGFAGDFDRHDLLRNQLLQLTGALGQFDGTGAGVDERGALQVRVADGSLRRIDSADVTVRRA
jgi:BirA family biotin operon repressor/biotin-[acetyl-CoA-carboxylase] ligase